MQEILYEKYYSTILGSRNGKPSKKKKKVKQKKGPGLYGSENEVKGWL